MLRISGWIVRHKGIVTLLFFVAAVVCVLLQFGVSVNYNMVDYLPEEAQSTKALHLMEREFAQSVPNARVMLRDVTIQEALHYKEKLKAIDGVSDVLWLDDVADLREPLEVVVPDGLEDYYHDGKALISLTIRDGEEVAVSDKIYALIGEGNALSGNAVDQASAQQMTGREAANALIIAIPVVLLILTLSTASWLEPLLFLLAIGVSVLINMGTNLIFGEISFITNSVSPILQMAVSLDYAIFLLNSFAHYREETDDVSEAMRKAMKRAFAAVAASAATTMFGFLALIFMRFRLGADLGWSLAKGVFLSFLSVMVFLPALTLSCYRLIDKTRHKTLLPAFSGIGKGIAKLKILVLLLVTLLLLPCYLAQSQSNFTYGTSGLSPESRSGQDTLAIEEEFGKSNAIVLLVPKGDAARERALGEDLKNLSHVTNVVSYAMQVGPAVPEKYLDSTLTKSFYSKHYARLILYTDTDAEGEEAFSLVEAVQAQAKAYYGDEVYSCGQSVSLYDMRDVITTDNRLVNLLAVLAIFLVLLVTFKSLTLPFFLLLTIETAIWINLAVPYFTGSSLPFIGYLIINTIQLGATVDYAILLTDHYLINRRLLPKGPALHKTMAETSRSILVSGAILSSAGLVLWLTSSNTIVSTFGLLIFRGTLLSMFMVLCFLPAILSLFDRAIEKTTYRMTFQRRDTP